MLFFSGQKKLLPRTNSSFLSWTPGCNEVPPPPRAGTCGLAYLRLDLLCPEEYGRDRLLLAAPVKVELSILDGRRYAGQLGERCAPTLGAELNAAVAKLGAGVNGGMEGLMEARCGHRAGAVVGVGQGERSLAEYVHH